MIAQYTGGCKYINPYHHLCPGRSEEQLWEEASHGSWGRPQGAGDSRGGGGGAHKQQRPDAHRRSVYVIVKSHPEFLSFKCQVFSNFRYLINKWFPVGYSYTILSSEQLS